MSRGFPSLELPSKVIVGFYLTPVSYWCSCMSLFPSNFSCYIFVVLGLQISFFLQLWGYCRLQYIVKGGFSLKHRRTREGVFTRDLFKIHDYLIISFSPWYDLYCTWCSRNFQGLKLSAEEKSRLLEFCDTRWFFFPIFWSWCGVYFTGFITEFFF